MQKKNNGTDLCVEEGSYLSLWIETVVDKNGQYPLGACL